MSTLKRKTVKLGRESEKENLLLNENEVFSGVPQESASQTRDYSLANASEQHNIVYPSTNKNSELLKSALNLNLFKKPERFAKKNF